MGDLNTGYFQPSQQLLRNGQVDADGKSWQIPMTFSDAWAELHPGNPDPSTINDDPVRLDAWLFYVISFTGSSATLGRESANTRNWQDPTDTNMVC